MDLSSRTQKSKGYQDYEIPRTVLDLRAFLALEIIAEILYQDLLQ